MDLVYILGTESAWNNNELKYSLRSVEKFVKGFRHIIIFGSKPDFIDFSEYNSEENGICERMGAQLLFVKHDDDMQLTKERRIMEKVKAFCNLEGSTDNFFFMNDDMFFLDHIDISQDFPNYYKGTLLNSAKKRNNDRYKRALMNCHNALASSKAKQLNNFDTHAPIVYNKTKFLEVMSRYNWNIRDGYVVKSLYANTLDLPGTFQPDCKIDEPMMPKRIWDKIVDRDFFSIGDNGLTDEMKNILQELYPNKSVWEK